MIVNNRNEDRDQAAVVVQGRDGASQPCTGMMDQENGRLQPNGLSNVMNTCYQGDFNSTPNLGNLREGGSDVMKYHTGPLQQQESRRDTFGANLPKAINSNSSSSQGLHSRQDLRQVLNAPWQPEIHVDGHRNM